ncbi:MAG: hypothetical protein KGJ13_03215 [Patescibacteria group bacterium]|nr:hypothetical protein [Patescibacteria group bacterium]
MIGSQGLRYLRETMVSDGKGGKKEVTLGDKVDLLPFEETEAGKGDHDYMAEHCYDLQKRDLGKGPYEIRQIGHWPCGRIMLYLKTQMSDGAGVYAEEFMAHNE